MPSKKRQKNAVAVVIGGATYALTFRDAIYRGDREMGFIVDHGGREIAISLNTAEDFIDGDLDIDVAMYRRIGEAVVFAWGELAAVSAARPPARV